jgi:hypothetical protein
MPTQARLLPPLDQPPAGPGGRGTGGADALLNDTSAVPALEALLVRSSFLHRGFDGCVVVDRVAVPGGRQRFHGGESPYRGRRWNVIVRAPAGREEMNRVTAGEHLKATLVDEPVVVGALCRLADYAAFAQRS